jgi:hypothetical protein
LIADNHSFVYGVIAGVLFMFIVGWIGQQRRTNRFKAGKATRNVTVHGNETPRDIVTSSYYARACATFWLIMMLAFFGVLTGFLFWVWRL